MPLGSFAFLPEIKLCCETASNQDIRFLIKSEKKRKAYNSCYGKCTLHFPSCCFAFLFLFTSFLSCFFYI